jgi:hypothetical protein
MPRWLGTCDDSRGLGPAGSARWRPPDRRWFLGTIGVKLSCVETESVVSNSNPLALRLTGGQKWMIAGLFFLQIPSSLIFYPLAAIFAITGIFVPIAMVLMGIGTLPVSFALKCKGRWQTAAAVPEGPAIAGQGDQPGIPTTARPFQSR